MRIGRLSILVASIAASSLALPAFGWGEKGHRITGELAWMLLKKETRAKLERLLPDEKISDVANWADQVRDERPETKPWHYVNVPEGAKGYDASRDCAGGKCIVAKLDEMQKKFADPKTPKAERIEALKWVVHFVGDLHQPLHVSHESDQGGNSIQVTFFGRPTNLHRLWDSDMIERFDEDSRTFADDLMREIKKEEADAWRSGTPAEWANESWALATTIGYLDTRGKKIENGDKLGRDYWIARSAIIDQQLKKAGVRLAWLIEQGLANDP